MSAPDIFCKNPKHEGRKISYICVKVGCLETRAHCMSCNLEQHRDCYGYVKSIEDYPLVINGVEKKNNRILEIFEQTF